MTSTRRSVDSERGATMVLFVLLLVSLIVVVALVVDVGVLRADRKSNKSTADHATAAGVLALEDELAGDGRPHPWRGVCEAYRYVKANGHELDTFDTESWTDQQAPPAPVTDPCSETTGLLGVACVPGDLTTYAWFRGTIDGGRVTVDIRSGYTMPDPDFSEDATIRNGDNGDPDEQGCDNLSVIIRESQPRGFSAVLGGDDLQTRVRTVGRVTLGSGFDAPVSLLLLERRECRALRVESVNSRVIVEHSDDDGAGPGTDGIWPGLIHADSDGSLCAADGTEHVLEGRVGADGGPTIVAQNATLPHPTVNTILPAQIGVFAKFFAGRPAHTPFPTTIGETDPIAAQRQGRRRVDEKYLAGVRAFADEASALVALNDPPVDSTNPWTVYSGSACTITGGTLPAPTVVGDPNKLWFKCPGSNGLWIRSPLTISTTDTQMVVTGKLRVDAAFEVPDLRKLWIRGDTSGGNPLGIDAQANLKLNTGGTAGPPCPTNANGETLPGKTASVFVGAGAFEMKSTSTPAKVFRACSTFILLKGRTSLPSTVGTVPVPSCESAVSAVGNTGPFAVSAGGFVQEWTAPNELASVQPTPAFLVDHPFEDLALWTEAAQDSTITGGGGTSIKGVFFLPNAHDFTILGSGAGEMPASAQFIACRMKVSGSGTLRMTPDAFNFVLIPSFVGFELVR